MKYIVGSLRLYFFLFKQKTAYVMRNSDWSSDVCSSDLHRDEAQRVDHMRLGDRDNAECRLLRAQAQWLRNGLAHHFTCKADIEATPPAQEVARKIGRASCRERVCQYV